jgi:hypothetical protein
MDNFKDYSELVEPLVLPIAGKQYTIPPVGAADGIRFNLAVDPTTNTATSISDDEFMRMFLGDALDEMVADNVPSPAMMRAAMTALADFQRGRSVAEVVWETGADPKALADYVMRSLPNRESKRKASKHSGGASSTKRQASGSGTKRRKR